MFLRSTARIRGPSGPEILVPYNYKWASRGSGCIDSRVKFKLFEIDSSKKQVNRTLKYLKKVTVFNVFQ